MTVKNNDCNHNKNTTTTTTSCCIQSNNVYMTRHSARADRDKNNNNWKPLPGRTVDDTECSKDGELASVELAKKFHDIPLSFIVSSPFYRCLQTVAPIAIQKGIKIMVEPGICEILSTFPPGFWDTEQLATMTMTTTTTTTSNISNNIENEGEINNNDTVDTLCCLPIDANYIPIMTRKELSREWSDGQAAERSKRVALEIFKRYYNNNKNDCKNDGILFCGHGASCLGIAEAFGGYGYVGYSSFSHFQSMISVEEDNDDDEEDPKNNKNNNAKSSPLQKNSSKVPSSSSSSLSWKVLAMGDVSHLSDKLRKQSLSSAW